MTKAHATIKSHAGHILWEGEAEIGDIGQTTDVTLSGLSLPPSGLQERKDWDLLLEPYHTALSA